MTSWKDLRRFLVNEGYEFIRHGGRDDIYEKTLENGNINRVRVSKGSGDISSGKFKRILKQQLHIDKEYFNKRLNNKKKK